MTPNQLRENIEDGLIRLKASYNACAHGYNRAMLKELSHSLRYWVDMRGQVNRYITEHRPTTHFWSYSIIAAFARKARDYEHLLINFPKSLVTASFPGVKQSQPALAKDEHEVLWAPVRPGGGKITHSVFCKQAGKNIMSVKHVIIVYDASDLWDNNQSQAQIDNLCFAYHKVKFGPWLDGLAVRINRIMDDGTLRMHDLSREKIIKRVANSLGGSHPEGAMVIDDESDHIIKHLLQYSVLDIPVPFAILLKIAHDILESFQCL